jgi:hypothetical protein
MGLFANTKLAKNEIQLVFIGDAACDLTKVVQTVTDIYGKEIAGQALFHTIPNGFNTGCHLLKRLVMPGIGHNGAFTIQSPGTDLVQQSLLEFLQTHTLFCSNPQYVFKAKKSLKAGLVTQVNYFIAYQDEAPAVGLQFNL